MSRSSPPSAVFDIDGTLIDTEPVVRQAYRDVGVEMPCDAMGVPWRSWLTPERVGKSTPDEVYRRKQLRYHELLDEMKVPVLPAGLLAMQLRREGWRVAAITMGAFDTAHHALTAAGVHQLSISSTRTPPEERLEKLADLAPQGMYFDDRWETCRLLWGSAWAPVWVTPNSTVRGLRGTVESWASSHNS